MSRLGALVRMAGSDWPATSTSATSNAARDGRASASRKSRTRSTIRTGDGSEDVHAGNVSASVARAATTDRRKRRLDSEARLYSEG